MAGPNNKNIKDHEVPNDEEEMESSNDDDETMDDETDKTSVEESVYLGGPLADDEELTFDKTAYHMYHAAQTGTPCLSFDVVPDNLGENRTGFPMSCYMVAGTQASIGKPNMVIAMKMSNLVKVTEDSDSDDSYIEEEGNEPKLRTVSLKHVGGVNRIRQTNANERKLAASWSDTGSVHVWDITDEVRGLDMAGTPQHQTVTKKPLFSFKGHQSEGFAMDWSPTVLGRLATGACNSRIHLWSPRDGDGWHVDQRALTSHTASVEDIQWSPNESNVFASCSVDQSIKIWDARIQGDKACMLSVHAHDADVNVMNWNRNDPFIVSGGDDGMLKVWDLRQFQDSAPVATFKHHTGAITSVAWHPTDSTVFAASGDDHQLTLWDLSVEKDDEKEKDMKLPPQLLFIHMAKISKISIAKINPTRFNPAWINTLKGQKDIKEVHWHGQLPGVVLSTASSGFNIFKTISI